MMPIGLHCRFAVRPGRIAFQKRFLDYKNEFDQVWDSRRVGIVEHLQNQHRTVTQLDTNKLNPVRRFLAPVF